MADMAKEQEKSFLPFHMRSACILWITCLNYIKMGRQLLYLQILYRNSIIYLDTTYKRELLIYIGKEKTRQLEKQIGFLMDLFVPLDISVQLFWDMHFGIISVEETMEPDDIMIY